MAGRIASSLGKLYHKIQFAIWDNVKGKLVSYGGADFESSIYDKMIKEDWEFCLRGLAAKILEYSPFPARLIYNP
jgi:hypothetical protein